MGMTDKQFNSWVRLLYVHMKEIQGQLEKEKLTKEEHDSLMEKFNTIMEILNETVRD